MNEQPESLRLADALEQDNRGYEPVTQAAAELRRLHEVNQELLEALNLAADALARSDYIQMDGDSFDVVDLARAAISKHGGQP